MSFGVFHGESWGPGRTRERRTVPTVSSPIVSETLFLRDHTGFRRRGLVDVEIFVRDTDDSYPGIVV